MNNLKVFENEEFGKIRTIEHENEPYFVGKDIAECLGYAKPENAIAAHVESEDKTSTLIQGSGSNYKSKAIIINESGIYSLILSSKLPTAKEFKHWVTSEVLPSIRKTGGYIPIDDTLSDTEILSKALLIAQKTVATKNKKLQEQQPKVLFADAVNASNTTILVGDLAKILKQNGIDIGANRLFIWLRNNGYLIKRNGTDYNMPTQKSMELGLFKIKETSISHSDGHITVSKTPKVTGKGQTYFINKFLTNK